MSDGIWSAGASQEPLHQVRLVRHRILTFNLSPTGWLNEGDASSYGSVAPRLIGEGTATARGLEGGPHFILSPETPDGRPTLGFEWCLTQWGELGVNAAEPADGAPGFTVTIWVLIGNSQTPDGQRRPVWAAFEPLTGVNYNELYHSFDTNATVLRFQITDYKTPVDPPPAPQSSSMCVVLSEL